MSETNGNNFVAIGASNRLTLKQCQAKLDALVAESKELLK
jgi:hypothetical protein